MLKRLDRIGFSLGGVYRRSTLNQISILMGILGILFVVTTASFIIWNERRTLFLEGSEHAERTAYFLADHAKRLFEVSDIALRATEAVTVGKDWATIERSPDIKASMQSMNSMLPYVSDIFLIDDTGRVVQATLDVPQTASIADRPVFREAHNPGDRLIIGDAIVARVTHMPTFLVARRIENPDGSFRGIVAVTMSLDYFTDYWRRLEIRNDERIALVRDGSGSILVRSSEPQHKNPAEGIGPAAVAAAEAAPDSGGFRPSPREFAYYHRIGDLPVLLVVSFSDTVITAAWIGWLWGFAPFVLMAFLVLAVIMTFGRRLAHRESRNRLEVENARAMLGASNVRLEQRVAERTADLLETNREVQRFAYIVSHDLRAPLVNIMGFTSELEGLRPNLFGGEGEVTEAPAAPVPVSQLREDFDEAIGFIKSSIDKMDRLIGAILALSRQGQRKFRPETLDMDVLMRSIADGVAHRLQQSGATLTIDPLPPLVADRIAIEQVFSNLIDNAVKYLQPGTPGQIRVSAQTSATTVTFEVRDNGRGIDPKDRDRVFDLFRRAGVQDQAGEGIGLANVRSLVRRLQGTILLDSTLGLGCVFSITLPKFGGESGDETL